MEPVMRRLLRALLHRLAERWLNPHHEPSKVAYQGGDLSNVRSFHCRDCQRAAVTITRKRR